jgi:HK97 family phage portal protein
VAFKDTLARIFGFDSVVKPLQNSLQRNERSEVVKNSTAHYPDWNIAQNSQKYCTIDDVYSIIRLLTTTSAMVPIYVYQVKDDAAHKKLKMLQPTSEQRLFKAYSTKALEDAPESDPLLQLIQTPNDYQTEYEFKEHFFSRLHIDGEAFIYKEITELGVNANKVSSMHILEPKCVVMHITTTFPQTITGYDYIINGTKILDNVSPETIIHVPLFNPSNNYTINSFRGLSPLKVLSKRTTRMESNMDASVAQIQNGGVPGIVYDKDTSDNAVDIVYSRKIAFSDYIKNTNNKGAPYFASGEMGYIPLGLKLADLESIELEKVDFKKLCNAYGISDILFNNSDGSTESNVKEQIKRMYTNSCLPNVFRLRDALIKGLLPHFNDKVKRTINADISEIPELQENYKDLAEWLNIAWWITPNEKREIMKFEKSNSDLFDEEFIPQNLIPISDLKPLDVLPLD